MLRAFTTVKFSQAAVECLPSSYQTVRWLRKPIWMPTAKSKLFKIPPRRNNPPEEDEEMKRLYNNYRTMKKSIRRFLTYRYSEDLLAPADTELLRKEFNEDFARCKEINDKWNEEIKLLREERVAQQLAADIQFAKQRMIEIDAQEQADLAEAEEMVRREKELVATFVTPENLDEVIEKAIDNPVDYNFAIDLDGNRIVGRETKPNEKVYVKQ